MSDNEVADAEIVDEPPATTAALVPVHFVESAIVRPVASLQITLDAFREYQAMVEKIVLPSDRQSVSGKSFITKSGWRKMATFMGVSSEIVSREYDRDEQNKITRAEVVVRAIAPNGRHMDGLGLCDAYERCVPGCEMGPRNARVPCDGLRHFSKPQHDIPATAYTRALNRACSDLFGFGEVSAEELGGEQSPPPDGFDSHEQAREYLDAILDAVAELPGYRKNADGGPEADTAAAAFAVWHREHKLKIPYTRDQCQLIDEKLHELTNRAPAPQAAPVDMGPADSARENAGDAKPGVASNASSATEPSGQAPAGEGENAVGTAANLPAGENPVDDVPVGSPPPGDDSTGAGPSPDSPARPAVAPKSKASTAQQRQRLGMRCVDLATKGYLKPGDKAEIVGVLTQSRAASTVDITEAEASKMTTLLALIEQGDIEMVDDPDHPGERAVSAVTTRAEDFLGPIIRGA